VNRRVAPRPTITEVVKIVIGHRRTKDLLIVLAIGLLHVPGRISAVVGTGNSPLMCLPTAGRQKPKIYSDLPPATKTNLSHVDLQSFKRDGSGCGAG